MAFAGCSVDYPEGRIACTSSAECPTGWVCVEHACYSTTSDVGVDATIAEDAEMDARAAIDAYSSIDAAIVDTNLSPIDAGADAASPDSSRDAGLGDVGACASGTVEWHDMNDPSRWTFLDLTTLNAGAVGFTGGVFDGRYVYLVPHDRNGNGMLDGLVARLDTTMSVGFGGAAWSFFDVSTVNGGARGFSGGAFDGRFVYLVPNSNGTQDGLVARLDTTAPSGFASAGAWSFFDTATLNANAIGFQGAAFDGQYLYLVPYTWPRAVVARLDTTASSSFASAGAWSFFDVSTLNSAARGFIGTAFDGHYVYLMPNDPTISPRNGTIARIDTTSPAGFATGASWTVFDVSTLNGGARGFVGASFDGHYLYPTPEYNTAFDGLVPRFDTTAASGFTSGSSWSFFDLTSVNTDARGFAGGAFDGRYVYFNQGANGAADRGIVARLDTAATGGFSAGASWSTFDVGTLDPGAAIGLGGGVFDGRYVYFVPGYWDTAGVVSPGRVARFDARCPSTIPQLPGWFSWGPGSFL
jgi:hypothetical protein